MDILTPTKKDIDRPGKKKRYSSSLRLWHWLSAIAITGSLLTVLVNSTILKAGGSVPLVQSSLAKTGTTISTDQARAVVHDLRDRVWDWHTYIGFGVSALLLFRLILEFFQLSDQKLIRKIKTAYHQYYVIKNKRETSRHEFWVKTLYAIFYLLLLVTVITGLDLAFEDDVPFLRKFHFMKEVHSFNMYLILIFIFVHLAGVFLAERRKEDKGIVSGMINGGEEL